MKRLLIASLLAFPLYVAASTTEEKEKTSREVTETSTILQGNIADVSNYKPLSEVRLIITDTKSDLKKIATTDEQGKFAITDLPAGVYKVRFEKEGYEPGSYQTLTVHEGGSNNFGFLLYEK